MVSGWLEKILDNASTEEAREMHAPQGSLSSRSTWRDMTGEDDVRERLPTFDKDQPGTELVPTSKNRDMSAVNNKAERFKSPQKLFVGSPIIMPGKLRNVRNSACRPDKRFSTETER
jgi:hypothetical protein